MGDSDTAIMWTIASIFLLLAFILPPIHFAFGSSQEVVDTAGFSTALVDSIQVNGLNALTVFISIISMFFFSFGLIPLWLDLTVFLSMRFILFYLIIRGARGV